MAKVAYQTRVARNKSHLQVQYKQETQRAHMLPPSHIRCKVHGVIYTRMQHIVAGIYSILAYPIRYAHLQIQSASMRKNMLSFQYLQDSEPEYRAAYATFARHVILVCEAADMHTSTRFSRTSRQLSFNMHNS